LWFCLGKNGQGKHSQKNEAQDQAQGIEHQTDPTIGGLGKQGQGQTDNRGYEANGGAANATTAGGQNGNNPQNQ
jgi:hypothetical protein